ncbi:hypothetical protein ACKWTF_012763 [Chironomus riparius]
MATLPLLRFNFIKFKLQKIIIPQPKVYIFTLRKIFFRVMLLATLSTRGTCAKIPINSCVSQCSLLLYFVENGWLAEHENVFFCPIPSNWTTLKSRDDFVNIS